MKTKKRKGINNTDIYIYVCNNAVAFDFARVTHYHHHHHQHQNWPLTIHNWPLTIYNWQFTIDHWPLTIDHWPLTIDHWPLAIDHWQLPIDHLQLYIGNCLIAFEKYQFCSLWFPMAEIPRTFPFLDYWNSYTICTDMYVFCCFWVSEKTAVSRYQGALYIFTLTPH